MINRYTRPAMGAIWELENKFSIWKEIEVLACEAQAELGKSGITKEEAAWIRAHAGDRHRQVSRLAWESLEKARATGLDVVEGDFAENVTTEGIDLLALPLGTRVRIGDDVLLELSQIGKVCHTKCAIYHLAGDCIFPREGIFFVALEGGAINVGDPVEVVALGDGTCAYTPPEALAELAAAQE